MLILLLCFNQITIHAKVIILFYFFTVLLSLDASCQKRLFANLRQKSIIIDGKSRTSMDYRPNIATVSSCLRLTTGTYQ
jgi:hypothetical protein